MHPTKTLIRLRGCAVWSESSLSSRRHFASLTIKHMPSKDSDQCEYVHVHGRRYVIWHCGINNFDDLLLVNVVTLLVFLFVALWFCSTRRFVVCLSVCHFVLVFFSPFSIAITSLGEERANLSAFRSFVRFVLVWICRFPLPLGVWKGLRFVIVALPGLFSYLF